MSKTDGQFPSAGRARRVTLAVAAVAALGLLLAACGGGGNGNGNGNGGGGFTLRVSFANETDAPAELALNEGEVQTVESCKGGVFTFTMPATDWTLTVNGETAIDSLEYQPNELDQDVAAELWLNEDGTTELRSFTPGSNITAPAALTICL